MSSTNGLIVAMLAVAVLAVAFWMLALSPKREEASEARRRRSKSSKRSLAQHRAEVDAAAEAREEFPVDYQQLVVARQGGSGRRRHRLAAGPAQPDRRALARSGSETFVLAAGEGEAPKPRRRRPSTEDQPAPVSPTEAAASLLPLGATIGPAGLGVMPYTLNFNGDFFQIADFIKGLDSLVKTENAQVAVDGRLITVDGFSLEADPTGGFPTLEATFASRPT